MTILHTDRLRLEPFHEDHVAGLHAMNSDPAVMRYITGRPETLDDTRAMVARIRQRWDEWGYGWWSFFEREGGELVGAGCIQHLGRDRANDHEIGWRLRQDRWGCGYASEAARRMAAFAFDDLQAPRLAAVCDPENLASAQVMKRLGMQYRGLERWYDADCDVYAITAQQWREQALVARRS